MIKIVILAIALGLIQAQKCPDSPVNLNFDAAQYLGRWYEIKVFPNFFQPDLSCVYATYGVGGVNNITVFNQGITAQNQLETIYGSATAPDANKPNHLLVILKVPIATGIFLPTTGRLDIWETDYVTYALAYSCTGTQAGETAWILSRKPTLDQSIIDRLEAKLRSAGVDAGKFKPTNQINCPNHRLYRL